MDSHHFKKDIKNINTESPNLNPSQSLKNNIDLDKDTETSTKVNPDSEQIQFENEIESEINKAADNGLQITKFYIQGKSGPFKAYFIQRPGLKDLKLEERLKNIKL